MTSAATSAKGTHQTVKRLLIKIWGWFGFVYNRAQKWSWSEISTIVIAIATLASVYVSRLQWNVLDRQLKEEILNQRPWITMDLRMNGPLWFDEGKQAQITLLFTLKNKGNAPAKNIQYSFGAYPITETNIFDSIPYQKRHCEKANESANQDSNGGRYLFPGDTSSDGGSTSVTYGQISAHDVWPDGKNVSFLIVGCVDYTYSSDGEHGQTGFSYTLNRKTSSGHAGGFNPMSDYIPSDALIFERHFFNGDLLN